MLVPTWEQHTTAAANADSPEELCAVLNRVIEQEGIRSCEKAVVVLGGDTRVSTAELMQAAREGVKLTGADMIDICVCTTPMLHYQVVRAHDSHLVAYYERLVNGFARLTTGTTIQHLHECITFRCD